jgi:signal transduction histidine kinase/DNA-binding response OmpR family regulator
MNKPFPVISHIVEERTGCLFLCTEGNGLIYYDLHTGRYTHFVPNEASSGSLPGYNIKTAWYDADRHELWLGLHRGGLCKLDVRRFRFTCYGERMPSWEQSNIVRSILPFGRQLLVATFNGIFLFDRESGRFSLFSKRLHEKVSYCIDMKQDGDGGFWIASRGVFYYHPEREEIRSYFFDPDDSSSLSNDDVQRIFIDGKNRVWIATNGGGVNLFNARDNSFIRYNSQTSGLDNDYVSNIMASRSGYLVITTTQGFSLLDADKGQVYNYSVKNGFPLNSLYNGGMCLTRSGEIVMAGMNGMVSFYEENLPVADLPARLYLVKLWVNNRLIRPGDETGVLNCALACTQRIGLNHRQHILSMEFASDNYIPSCRLSYRYRLTQYRGAVPWTELPRGTDRLHFMNLTPGDYRLAIEGLSPNSGRIVASTELKITVAPPFYQTWYAYLGYFLVVCFGVWRYAAFTRSKLLLKASLDYEKKEKEHLEEVNRSKLDFFTNISHEFRTPLTLINGQADQLLQGRLSAGVQRRVLSIKSNVRDMQHLITELLEFRKIEQGHLKIKACRMDIVAFMYEIYRSFSGYADSRRIRFEFASPSTEVELWFDPVQIQKVFYNLLSNAFKYTPVKGRIGIEISDTRESVLIKIIDSGIGIAAGETDKIFNCFYQAGNGAEINTGSPGAGIGLAFTKSILNAHRADIRVDSRLDAGSTFTVVLLKGDAHFEKSQLGETQDLDRLCIAQIEDSRTRLADRLPTPGDASARHAMLIVEDHEELRLLLKNVFDPIYHVYTAANGEEGLQIALARQPDIILCDVMMPVMSGLEMCARLKSNFSVCHIPLILLTARAAAESNIEGWQLGADDYVTKPFDTGVLIMRCHNLINGRKLLQEKFGKQVDASPRLMATNRLDGEFLEKTQAVIERNITNPAFDVQFLSQEMGLGRTKLFDKIKGITGQTPNEFILTIRLKKAAALLATHPEYNVSDVCYDTGFNTPKYFAKCFRERFGISPSAYRKEA